MGFLTTLALIVAILVLLSIVFDACNDKKHETTLKELQEVRAKLADDSSKLKVYIANDSTKATQIQALSGIADDLVKELHNVDAINDKYKIKIGKLEGVLSTRLRDTIYLPQDTAYLPGDTKYLPDSSAHTLTGRFNNHWYAATATVSSDPMKMKGSLSLIVIDSVKYFFDSRKTGTWPFRKENSYVTIVHANPFIAEKGAQFVKVPTITRSKKWAIGIQTGVLFYPNLGSMYVGAGITRTLIRF